MKKCRALESISAERDCSLRKEIPGSSRYSRRTHSFSVELLHSFSNLVGARKVCSMLMTAGN